MNLCENLNENGVAMKKENLYKTARRVRNRDSNGKLIHRARSPYFSALGVVMNIKPARVNPTTRTSATRSEFRRVRRPATVCNERVFSAERNTNCALTPFPAPWSPSTSSLSRHVQTHSRGLDSGFTLEMRGCFSAANVSVALKQPGIYPDRFPSRRHPVPLDHPFRRCILPRASVARARGTFSPREQTSGVDARGQVVTGCACFLAAERTRARHNALAGIHKYRAPTRWPACREEGIGRDDFLIARRTLVTPRKIYSDSQRCFYCAARDGDFHPWFHPIYTRYTGCVSWIPLSSTISFIKI